MSQDPDMENDGKTSAEIQSAIQSFNHTFNSVEMEVRKIIVGMQDVVRFTLSAIFAGGHVLLEGSPGLGKTLLVKSISKALGLSFKRIQFTPDLMPSDITGTEILTEDDAGRRRFVFKAGPIFANIVLADEINRATPKTQSALLEAMEEKQITVLNETHPLNKPFFVLATQNQIELEGTYPLPEAQLDRFLFKLLVPSPTSAELKEVLYRTTGVSIPEPATVIESEKMIQTMDSMKNLVRQVVVAGPLMEILVRLVGALSPDNKYATQSVKKYVRFGPGPRGAQSVMLAAKVSALLDQRINLSYDDIKLALTPALRHRLVLNFQAEADNITADDIIKEIKDAK